MPGRKGVFRPPKHTSSATETCVCGRGSDTSWDAQEMLHGVFCLTLRVPALTCSYAQTIWVGTAQTSGSLHTNIRTQNFSLHLFITKTWDRPCEECCAPFPRHALSNLLNSELLPGITWTHREVLQPANRGQILLILLSAPQLKSHPTGGTHCPEQPLQTLGASMAWPSSCKSLPYKQINKAIDRWRWHKRAAKSAWLLK